MKNSIFFIFLIPLFLNSCGKKSTSLQPEIPKKPITTVLTNLNNTLMLKLVNDKRAIGCNCGVTVMPPVSPLSWNNLLASAASSHAKDMAVNNFFAHESSNGKKIEDRYALVGYKWIFLAENLANGQIDEQEVVSAWLLSESHCKNMMNPNVKELGAAKEGKYWVQNFGAK